jgi:TonB family protein
MSSRLHFASALIVFLASFVPCSAVAQDRAPVVDRLINYINSAHLQKIYVSDFPDASGHQSDVGAFFAASFSKLLSEKAKQFTVQNRVEAHTFLLQSKLTDYDLSNPTNLASFVEQFHVDAVLLGTVRSPSSVQGVDLKLIDPSGNQLYVESYSEPAKRTDANFPAGSAPSGWPFFYVGLDGVSQPTCYYAPNPPYTDDLRRDRVSGVVLVSGLITAEGKVSEARISQSVDKRLDKPSLKIISIWRCKPAEDENGDPVPVRIGFEITFKLF